MIFFETFNASCFKNRVTNAGKITLLHLRHNTANLNARSERLLVGSTPFSSRGTHSDLQFRYIRGQIRSYKANVMAVISIDTKSRELIGPFHQAGRK
jgi:DDE family transposase